MNLEFNAQGLCLKPKQLLKVRGGIGHAIVCHSGCLWVTQHRDPRDIVMGAGETIMEGVQFGADGQLSNPNLHGYLIMTIKDAPDIFSGIVDSYEPRGPFGAKETGEGPVSPTAPAIADAVWHATGFRPTSLPITPEKVLEGLDAQKKETVMNLADGTPSRAS